MAWHTDSRGVRAETPCERLRAAHSQRRHGPPSRHDRSCEWIQLLVNWLVGPPPECVASLKDVLIADVRPGFTLPICNGGTFEVGADHFPKPIRAGGDVRGQLSLPFAGGCHDSQSAISPQDRQN